MNTLKNSIIAMSMLAVASVFTVACSSSDEVMEGLDNNNSNNERLPNYATMQLDGSITPFDATRATTAEWEHDDKIYLQFTVGTSIVDGTATYDATTQEWNVQYYGTLTTGTESKCEAYYFENAGDASRITVRLDEHSAIYVDKSASYLFEDGVLKVTASLTPMTGRIRFKGKGSESYRFTGISYYNTYSITTNSFTSTELNQHSSKTKTDGYSEYYYGFFADESNKYMCFDDYDNGVSYTRLLGEQALAVGRSGYLDIPTAEKSNGWSLFTYKDFTVSKVKFRMIRVITENAYFYIGETEVTQELWEKVMGSGDNPSTFTGENLPVNNLGYWDCTNFISKLNEKTGMTFRLPTQEEWKYAAQGGSVSNNYTHCGSNDWDAVAWCSENSDNMPHPVKSKLPNEIGIYDMSGNVAEFVAGDGNYRYFCGGSYLKPYTECEKWDVLSVWFSDSATDGGFRFVVDNIE